MTRSMAPVLEKERSTAPSQTAEKMANTKSGGVGDRPTPRLDRTRGGGDAEAFDIWLQRGLHQLYDSVAKEPVPDELLRMIEQDLSDRTK